MEQIVCLLPLYRSQTYALRQPAELCESVLHTQHEVHLASFPVAHFSCYLRVPIRRMVVSLSPPALKHSMALGGGDLCLKFAGASTIQLFTLRRSPRVTQ